MAKFAIILVLLTLVTISWQLKPILLVPGFMASQIYANYTKPPPHSFCGPLNKPFCAWINIKFILPFMQDCMIKSLELHYDNMTHTTRDADFIKTWIPGFGTTYYIEYLSNTRIWETTYYNPLIQALERIGYKRNQNIRGAPYEFRKGLNELQPYIIKVKDLIETMYKDSGNKKVILLGHSMGNLNILKLLNLQTNEWKRKYVEGFVSVSAPYGGAVEAILAVLTGTIGNHFSFINPIKLQTDASSWPAIYQLFPLVTTFLNKPLVLTSFGNFTASSMRKLMKLSKIQNAVNHYEDTHNANYLHFRNPNVPMYCIYSRGMKTFELLDYRKNNFPKGEPNITYGEGDGTVNIQSLQQCQRLMGGHSNESIHIFQGVSHKNILKYPQFIDTAVKIVQKMNSL